MDGSQESWRALLIGGVSGTGKSTAARQLARATGSTWVQVDDLKLALQRSRVSLSERTDALYFFLQEGVWRREPDELRDAFVAFGEVMSPAIEVVIENHVDQDDPAVIEGDSVLPSLLGRPAVQDRSKHVQAVFLVEPDEVALLQNMLRRDRGFLALSTEEQRAEARAKWLYGQWLAAEAQRCGFPVLEPRPWETLCTRILHLAPASVRS